MHGFAVSFVLDVFALLVVRAAVFFVFWEDFVAVAAVPVVVEVADVVVCNT